MCFSDHWNRTLDALERHLGGIKHPSLEAGMEGLGLTISLALDSNQRLVSLVVPSVSHARVGAFPEDLRRLSSIAITSSNLSHGGLGSN